MNNQIIEGILRERRELTKQLKENCLEIEKLKEIQKKQSKIVDLEPIKQNRRINQKLTKRKINSTDIICFCTNCKNGISDDDLFQTDGNIVCIDCYIDNEMKKRDKRYCPLCGFKFPSSYVKADKEKHINYCKENYPQDKNEQIKYKESTISIHKIENDLTIKSSKEPKPKIKAKETQATMDGITFQEILDFFNFLKEKYHEIKKEFREWLELKSDPLNLVKNILTNQPTITFDELREKAPQEFNSQKLNKIYHDFKKNLLKGESK